jgi:hypothetical protein
MRTHEAGHFSNPLLSVYLHHGVEALLRGGDGGLAREEGRRLIERARINGRDRMSHFRTAAVLSEWEGEVKRALDYLWGAEALAEKIGLPGELWQIRAKLGELHERCGEPGEARGVFLQAAQTLRGLAEKIEDEGLREGFLSAPRARRVLAREEKKDAP